LESRQSLLRVIIGRGGAFIVIKNLCCIGLLALTVSAQAQAAQGRTVQTIYEFKGGTDGWHPNSRLVADKNGNLYGTTWVGGGAGCRPNGGCGTVFRIGPDGTETVLHAFSGHSDGRYPIGVVVDQDGVVFGTTGEGGGTDCFKGYGCGIVFKIAPDGTETVLYAFVGGQYGYQPASPPVIGSGGMLYGATIDGGLGNKQCGHDGCGTVFSLAPDGTETLIYAFKGGSDGAHPFGRLVLDDTGNLFGTAETGGQIGYGTAYEVSPKGLKTTLYSFHGAKGGGAPLGLVPGINNDFYGSTYDGGGGCDLGHGCGTVFHLTRDGAHSVILRFQKTDLGEYFGPNLALDESGNIYGTAAGGTGRQCNGGGCGLVFELSPDGVETVLYQASGRGGSGINPNSVMVMGNQLFGTTSAGGDAGCDGGCGTVFELTPP
jgi:uncharacterized repeat protein (TIGR03803 family)